MTIFDAIEQADLGRVWQLAQRAGNLRAIDTETHLTPLALAAELGHVEIVRLLLEAEADPDEGGATTPLEAAVLEGEIEIVELLLESGADVNRRVGEGFTPLMTAAFTGDEEIAFLLLEAGGRPRARNDDGHTAIDLASAEGHEDLARELRTFSRKDFLERQARREAEAQAREQEERRQRDERRRAREAKRREEEAKRREATARRAQQEAAEQPAAQETPEAAPAGDDPLARAKAFFAEMDADTAPAPDLDGLEGIDRLAALLEADDLEAARRMVETGEVGPEDRDERGRTPLMLAASNGALELVELLLAAGVEVDAEDDSEAAETALLKAINHPTPKRLEIVQRLVENGADLERRHGPNRTTPLMTAATADVYIDDPHHHIFATATRQLLELGADPEAKDRRGNTVWRLIKRNAMAAPSTSPHRRKLHQMLKVLESAGAEILASHQV